MFDRRSQLSLIVNILTILIAIYFPPFLLIATVLNALGYTVEIESLIIR